MELQNTHTTAKPYQSQSDGMEMDISNCRVRWSIAGMAECMVPNLLCPCKLSYGNSRFCRHPMAKQIAESSLPQCDY